jgi:hypothetical protein
MFLKILGVLMLMVFFGGIFTASAMTIGFMEAVKGFSFAIIATAWALAAIWFIVK